MQAEEELVFPDFIEVSHTARDFIERVLTKYPCNRLRVGEIAEHGFLSGVSLFDYHNEMAGNYGEATP